MKNNNIKNWIIIVFGIAFFTTAYIINRKARLNYIDAKNNGIDTYGTIYKIIRRSGGRGSIGYYFYIENKKFKGFVMGNRFSRFEKESGLLIKKNQKIKVKYIKNNPAVNMGVLDTSFFRINNIKSEEDFY